MKKEQILLENKEIAMVKAILDNYITHPSNKNDNTKVASNKTCIKKDNNKIEPDIKEEFDLFNPLPMKSFSWRPGQLRKLLMIMRIIIIIPMRKLL